MNGRLRLTMAALWLFALAPACGDSGATPGPAADTPDTTVANDTGATTTDTGTPTVDVVQQDVNGPPEDVAGDTAAEPDVVDAGVDTVDAGAPLCSAGQTECVSLDGLPDPSLCPSLVDFDCVDGCCVEKFKCKADSECAQFSGEGECPDTRFACLCEVGSGGCYQYVCQDDAGCDEGEICANGLCKATPVDLLARIVSRGSVTTEGTSITLVGEAYEADDPTVVLSDVELEWDSSDDAIATVVGGVVTGGSTAGTASITVKVKGGTVFSAPVLVSNYAALGENEVRVIVADSNTKAPVAGHVLLRGADGAEAWGELVDGAFVTTDVAPPVDVHVFAEGHSYVSVFGVTAADVVLFSSPLFRAKLELEDDGTMVPEKQDIVGEGSIITGMPDYSLYSKSGEIVMGITSLGITDGLFNFDLPLVIGPDVKRYYDPQAPSIFASDKQEKLPGGVTFEFAAPVLVDYWLAAPPGVTTLWSLAGRVASNDPDLFPKISEIFGSIDNGINFETLLSALFPLFKTFYSGVSRYVTLDVAPTYPPPVVDSVLTMPLVTQVDVELPPLPTVGADDLWADLALVIGAAVTPDELMTPLGITAGGDKRFTEDVADGIVDGNNETEDVVEPFDLRMAPPHSGLQGPSTELALFVVAAALNVSGGSDKPEAGSGYLFRMKAGEPMAKKAPAPVGGFLPISFGTTYGSVDVPEDRTLTLAPVDGASFHRVVLRAPDATQWAIYLPDGIDTVELPNPETFDESVTDVATAADSFVVNAFVLEPDASLESLVEPGGRYLDALLHVVAKASYINVKK